MPIAAIEVSTTDGGAPSYTVAKKRIISIEHPCIVRSFDDGFKSLGGEHQLNQVLEPRKKPGHDANGLGSSVAVSLRPNDRLAQKVTSTVVATQNVLIKVSLPKKTGRKRKRGSNDPFAHHGPTPNDRITAAELMQRMRDNITKYQIEPVGMIEETHVFNRLPDYQVRASEVPVMRQIRDYAMSSQYEDLREFHVDLPTDTDGNGYFPGPPLFTQQTETGIWGSRQDERRKEPSPKPQPEKKKKRRLRKSHAPAAKARNDVVTMDVDEVPQQPPPGLGPPGAIVARAISDMKRLLEDRPIVTCRAAHALLKDHTMKAVAQTMPYVGYFAGKGPWRDAIIKYGVDPRCDPKYRKYQTFRFTVYAANKVNAILQQRAQPVEPHLFNGKAVSEIGAIWQLCDLTDPLITEVLNTTNIRTDCDKEKHGWYFNGTIAKVRILMREKMRCILTELPIPQDDHYRVLNTLPDHILEDEPCELPSSYPAEVRQLALDIAKAARRGEPKPYKFLQSTPGTETSDSEADAATSGAEDESEEDRIDSEAVMETNADVSAMAALEAAPE